MFSEESEKRQDELRSILYEMAASEMNSDEIKPELTKLKAIYTDNFRHSYADFFPLIVDIAGNKKYNLDLLSSNLSLARTLAEKSYIESEDEFRSLYESLSKLSDHISLEIGRYNYYSINENRVEDLEKRNKGLQESLSSATIELDSAKTKINSIQTELVTVLSVFAAIVLAFSGSLSFLGNALSNISKAPFFKLTFLVLLCGLIIFNLIFLMLYIVGKITERNIYARCKSENCTCGKNGAPSCKGITRVRKRLPYVFWTNTVLVLLLIADIAVWFLNEKFWHFSL